MTETRNIEDRYAKNDDLIAVPFGNKTCYFPKEYVESYNLHRDSFIECFKEKCFSLPPKRCYFISYYADNDLYYRYRFSQLSYILEKIGILMDGQQLKGCIDYQDGFWEDIFKKNDFMLIFCTKPRDEQEKRLTQMLQEVSILNGNKIFLVSTTDFPCTGYRGNSRMYALKKASYEKFFEELFELVALLYGLKLTDPKRDAFSEHFRKLFSRNEKRFQKEEKRGTLLEQVKKDLQSRVASPVESPGQFGLFSGSPVPAMSAMPAGPVMPKQELVLYQKNFFGCVAS